MMATHREPDGHAARTKRRMRLFGRFARSSDGAAAIEFALLAIPYFMIIFAIIETFIAFAGEELVSSAVDTLARKVRTGQITYNLGRTTDMTQAQFRQAFCDEIAILMKCSTTEVATPSKLYLDVKTYSTFAAIPTSVPLTTSGSNVDLNTSGIAYSPGGRGTINMIRAYYRWVVITDLIRPYLSTIRPSGSASQYLIVSTAVFQNEQYP